MHPEVGTTVYGRDAVGNMTTKQVGASGVTTYDYDGRNRLWRVTYPNNAPSQVTNVYWRTDKLTLAATYNYNANDQLASIVYPVLNRTVSFIPNALGRPTTIVTPTGTMLNAAFWPNGQIYDIAYAGGSRVTYEQTTREWLRGVAVKTGDNVSRIASTLVYDVAGNLVQVSDSVDATYNRTMAFDAINRLVTASGAWGSGSMTYSGAGNVLTQVVGAETRTNTYDAQNRLASVSRQFGVSGGAAAYTVSYDVYGNAQSAEGEGYNFDSASNLVSTWGGEEVFGYDGANTRVKTSRFGVVTYEFRSAHGLLLAEWRKQSGYYDTLKEHMYLAGKEVAEQRTDFLGSDVLPFSWMFLQPDANGSPISATSAGGGLLFKENYQPYGSQINNTAAGYTQRGFAGHTQDKPALVYMGGRYYSPLTARFLSIDPKEADPSDLHSLNRYAYANNNPYRYVDPDGHTPVDLAFFAVDAVRLGVAIYSGGDVGGAAMDLGLSAIGVMSPVPGAGQALKALKVADKVVEGARAADNAVAVGFVAKGGTYVLKDAEGTIVKTGRTNNLARREAEHGRNHPDKTFEVDKRTDSRAAQRGREQDLHDANPSAHAKNGGMDKINGISPNNPNRNEYLRAGRELP